MVGIYKIENLINHKCYVGQSIHIEKRWKEHCYPSKNSVIANAIKKYGKENFSFQILEECSEDELDEKENYYIQYFNCIVPNGYNVIDYSEGQCSVYHTYDKETFLEIISDIKEDVLSIQQISEKFDINKSTVYRLINGEIHRLAEESYPLRQIKNYSKDEHCCLDCGVKISKRATRCVQCAHKKQQKCERPNRKELKNLIRNYSFSELGRQFGVSDKAIGKWCVSENLPKTKKEIKSYTDEEWINL